MNTEERKRLRELSDKATPGPWELEERGYSVCPIERNGDKLPAVAALPGYVKNGGQEDFWAQWISDAAFIAAARSAVPELLDALDEAEADRDELKALDAEAQHGADEQTKQMLRLQAENAALRAELERSRDLVTNLRLACECLHSAKERYADIAEKSEAEEIVKLRDRVEKLEEVRKAATLNVEKMERITDIDWTETDEYWALRAALDRAGEP